MGPLLPAGFLRIESHILCDLFLLRIFYAINNNHKIAMYTVVNKMNLDDSDNLTT